MLKTSVWKILCAVNVTWFRVCRYLQKRRERCTRCNIVGILNFQGGKIRKDGHLIARLLYLFFRKYLILIRRHYDRNWPVLPSSVCLVKKFGDFESQTSLAEPFRYFYR